ncbi:double C2-like domain-containing protein alpha-like [Scleropages formosus]|uniref:Double C2-like domain-containing protein alpha-like n=1 Tax=Scleropages formosus TaxID=113540 RepID=A0A0P7TWL8_SCLFO|nr:double C2-like domain-containing protein alpha-like [Scleropages formosus]
MTVRKGKKLTISIQEHMAIDVCPGPIRPIRQISAYFPRLSPTSSISEPLSPNPAGFPSVLSPGSGASGAGTGGLLSPVLPGAAGGSSGGGGSLSAMSSMDTSIEIDSCDSDDSTSLGTLEFDLLYERATSSLRCTVLRAKGLKPMDFNGLADPYDDGCFYISRLSRPSRVSVCDEDKLSHNEFIGESRVALRRLKPDQPKHYNICLEHPPPLPSPSAMSVALRGISCYLREWENEQQRSLEERGRILLSLQFVSPSNEGERDGQPKEKVRSGLYLKPDLHKKSKHKTAVMKKTLNPEFNEEFFYEISFSELSTKTLEVTVWDYDLGKSNDFIGGVSLGCHSQGDALRHWVDCLKNKGKKIERWHTLTNDLPGSTYHD